MSGTELWLSRWKREGLHDLFEIGVILKGLNAALELVSGLLLLFVDVRGIIDVLIQNELVEDPTDFLATHLKAAVAKLPPGAEFYSALYLISHAIVKAVLVWGLLRKKLWAYPASIAILFLFIAYQSIKYLETRSIALLALTVFDAALMYLIWHEYSHMQNEWRS